MCMPACFHNPQPASQLWTATSDATTSPPPKLPTTSNDRWLLGTTYPRFGQLLDLLNFFVGDDVDVANDVGPVPLVLLLDGPQHKLGVVFVVVVTTEQFALSAGRLEVKKTTRSHQVVVWNRHHFEPLPSGSLRLDKASRTSSFLGSERKSFETSSSFGLCLFSLDLVVRFLFLWSSPAFPLSPTGTQSTSDCLWRADALDLRRRGQQEYH